MAARRTEAPVFGLLAGDCEQLSERAWTGPVVTRLGKGSAYIKLLSPSKLLIECIAAMVGRAHDLPVPPPMLLLVADGKFLPGIEPPAFSGWLFGSLYTDAPSLSRLTRDPDQIGNRIRQWKRAPEGAAFDSWIGNQHRNTKYILCTDDSSRVGLVDHDDAFPDWLMPEADSANKIMEILCRDCSEMERHRCKRSAQSATRDYPSTDWNHIEDTDQWARRFGRAEDLPRLLTFLAARLAHLPDLLAIAAGTNQREMHYAKQRSATS